MVALDIGAEERAFMESARRAVRANPWLMKAEARRVKPETPDARPLAFGMLGLATGSVAAAASGIALAEATPFLMGSLAHKATLLMLLVYYLGLGFAALRTMYANGRLPNLMWFVAGSFFAVVLKEVAQFSV